MIGAYNDDVLLPSRQLFQLMRAYRIVERSLDEFLRPAIGTKTFHSRYERPNKVIVSNLNIKFRLVVWNSKLHRLALYLAVEIVLLRVDDRDPITRNTLAYLLQRHKVQGRGTRRFSREALSGDLSVLLLKTHAHRVAAMRLTPMDNFN